MHQDPIKNYLLNPRNASDKNASNLQSSGYQLKCMAGLITTSIPGESILDFSYTDLEKLKEAETGQMPAPKALSEELAQSSSASSQDQSVSGQLVEDTPCEFLYPLLLVPPFKSCLPS